MNTKIYSLMLGLLTLTGLLTGCKSDEDITFDHERQQFETRADRISPEPSTARKRPSAIRSIC